MGTPEADLSTAPARSRQLAQAWRPRLPSWAAARRWFVTHTFTPPWLRGRWRHPIVGYLVAALLQAIASGITLLFLALFPDFAYPGLLAILVVACMALAWGAGPSLLATLLGALLLHVVVLPPVLSQFAKSRGEAVAVVLFLIVGLIITAAASQTERARRDAQALARREAETAGFLDAAVESMADGVDIYDRNGRMLRANTALRALFAVDRDPSYYAQPAPERVEIWQTRDDQGRPLPPERGPMQRVLEGATFTGAEALELQARTLDGQELQISVTGAPVRDVDGEIAGGVLVVRDVTARRQAERRVRVALDALLAMAEALVEGPETADPPVEDAASATRAVGQRLVELTRDVLGLRRAGLVAYDAETGLLHPVALVGVSPEVERAWRRGLEERRWAPRPIAPDIDERLRAGEALVIDRSQPPLRDRPNPFGLDAFLLARLYVGAQFVGYLFVDDGGADHVYTPHEIALVKAVARLAALAVERERLLGARMAAARLRELDRLRSEFVAAVSHDLQTPLTANRAVLGLLETSAAGRLTSDEQALLRNARRNTERLRLQIDDLLAVNKIEAGTLRVERTALDLTAVTLEALAVVQPLMQDKGQTLEVDLPAALPCVGDARLLEHALVNVLSNAHRHTPAGTCVTLSGRLTAHEVLLSVRDDGPGIPADELERIFERFHHLASGVGSGLGLAIARDIVALHGGRLWAESAKGAGATFWVALPRDDDARGGD